MGLFWTLTSWLTITVNICTAAWPNGPFTTSGRWITDASGANITHVGVNWPGHGEVMIPEGLQHQAIPTIVSKIKSLGMNAIRLTYAIEMIDQIYDNGDRDVTIEVALTSALGHENGSKILERVIQNNPSFSSTTTRLQVFDAVAAECARQEIYIALDNHVSKAGWCCNPLDGNSWWGDTYFSVTNWTRGLSFMAEHGKSWPALTSMSLRNEPRQPLTNFTLYSETYNWQTWYHYTKLGASAINAANADLLILLPGMDSSTQLGAIVRGEPLAPGTAPFNKTDFARDYTDKLVLEMHAYSILASDRPTDCASFAARLYSNGFEALADGAANRFPLLVTEFGFAQDETTWRSDVYAVCIADYLPAQRVGWFLWVVAGSYYVREGRHDDDEPWGLLTHDWSGWRSPGFVEGGLTEMVDATLEWVGRGAVEGGEGDGGSGGGSGSVGNGQASENAAGAGRHTQAFLVVLVWTGMAILISSRRF
ncbi:Putative beta--galactanase [Madurella fahalii]|uniref:Beta--galactanase n=1 Tax=Madurella fahalii TaxID=1157608 RepID=A0ABQ0G4Z3_9PEZI